MADLAAHLLLSPSSSSITSVLYLSPWSHVVSMVCEQQATRLNRLCSGLSPYAPGKRECMCICLSRDQGNSSLVSWFFFSVFLTLSLVDTLTNLLLPDSSAVDRPHNLDISCTSALRIVPFAHSYHGNSLHFLPWLNTMLCFHYSISDC